MSDREQWFVAEIVDGRLVISIGIDALMDAVKATPVWEDQLEDERGWSISNVDAFAQDILDELRREEEDGTTPVHLMFDAAIEEAFNQGSLNVDYGADA